LSVSKSVSAYSPSSSSKLKMTFVVAAVAAASESAKTAVAATALIRRQVGDFMETIPTGAGRRVKHVFVKSRSSQSRLEISQPIGINDMANRDHTPSGRPWKNSAFVSHSGASQNEKFASTFCIS